MSILIQPALPYRSELDIRQTQFAIKQIKDFFQGALARRLNLFRVTAPLFVDPKTGLNDNLNGVERPVHFDVLETGVEAEVVHSLAKWKREALWRYRFAPGEGLYTDMNAIRRDEETDNLHSLYVDQWDWEKIISKETRTVDTLTSVVRDIYAVMKETEEYICGYYGFLPANLPEEITFITAQELEDRYPDLTPKEREKAISKEYGAVFIMGIGGRLKSGKPHDGRAPDYDDWNLNGDIIVYYPLLDIPFEISSMGIRVDEVSLLQQLKEADAMDRLELPFQQMIYHRRLPYTIGGGIGQSRLCMLFLNKAHIGEVQSSLWPEEHRQACTAAGIELL